MYLSVLCTARGVLRCEKHYCRGPNNICLIKNRYEYSVLFCFSSSQIQEAGGPLSRARQDFVFVDAIVQCGTAVLSCKLLRHSAVELK